MSKFLPDSADEIVRICQFGARFEAKRGCDMEAARRFWTEKIFPLGYNVNYNLQMEFINLERAYGNVKHCRRHFHKVLPPHYLLIVIFKNVVAPSVMLNNHHACKTRQILLSQALNSSSQLDYPEALFDAYLSFEREEGSLEEVMEATDFVAKQRKIMKEREAKRAEKEAKEADKKGGKGGGKAAMWAAAGGKSGGSGVNAANAGGRGGGLSEGGGKNKRPHNGSGDSSEKQNGVPAKKIKDNNAVAAPSSNDGFKVPQLPKMPAGKSPKPSSTTKVDSKPANNSNATPTSQDIPVDEALEKRDRTVFVSNMNFQASEDDLRDAFKFCGPISSIRLVTDNKTGKPRGGCLTRRL